MSKFSRMTCVLAVVVWSAYVTGAVAEDGKGVEPNSPASLRQLPSEAPVAIGKECIGAEGAQVCWLQFTDGTRCVVASNADGGDSSTALNCHFSTPMERLHRMPKD